VDVQELGNDTSRPLVGIAYSDVVLVDRLGAQLHPIDAYGRMIVVVYRQFARLVC
jgi:hypothetical protein